MPLASCINHHTSAVEKWNIKFDILFWREELTCEKNCKLCTLLNEMDRHLVELKGNSSVCPSTFSQSEKETKVKKPPRRRQPPTMVTISPTPTNPPCQIRMRQRGGRRGHGVLLRSIIGKVATAGAGIRGHGAWNSWNNINISSREQSQSAGPRRSILLSFHRSIEFIINWHER